jgi:hypothetical protein
MIVERSLSASRVTSRSIAGSTVRHCKLLVNLLPPGTEMAVLFSLH